MRVSRAVALAATLALLTGCTGGGGAASDATPSRAAAPTGRPPATTPTTSAPVAPACATEADDGALAHCLQGLLDAAWSAEFTDVHRDYTPPRLVAPDPAKRTGPDAAYISSRAFYDDGTIHVPTGYLAAIHARFGSRSPLVVAFALAHETGHHVQDLLGLFDRAHARSLNSDDSSRRVEMQADCFAGVWAHAQANAGRMDEAAFAVAADGELARLSQDTIGGTIDPRVEVRTHGTVAQRSVWLARGLESGDPASCDTFAGSGVTLRLPWAAPARSTATAAATVTAVAPAPAGG